MLALIVLSYIIIVTTYRLNKLPSQQLTVSATYCLHNYCLSNILSEQYIAFTTTVSATYCLNNILPSQLLFQQLTV